MKKLSLVFAFLIASFIACPNASRAQEVKIYGYEGPPFNYTENGKLTGITTDIVEGLKKSMGLTTAIEMVPTARAIDYVQTTPHVVLLTFAKTPEREKLGLHFIGPVATLSHTLWKKKGAPMGSVNGLADVKSQNLTVGAMLGDWRAKFVEDAGVTVSPVATNDLNLKKLMADRLPLMISSSFEMSVLTKSEGLKVADLEPVYTIKETSSYLMFSKDTDQATLDKWQNAYATLEKTDFFTELADKWSPVLGLNLKFAADKGIYVQ